MAMTQSFWLINRNKSKFELLIFLECFEWRDLRVWGIQCILSEGHHCCGSTKTWELHWEFVLFQYYKEQFCHHNDKMICDVSH